MTSAHYMLSDLYVSDDIENLQSGGNQDTTEDNDSEHSEQVGDKVQVFTMKMNALELSICASLITKLLHAR